MIRKIKWLIIGTMAILLIGSSFSYADGIKHKKIVLVLINQLSIMDQIIYSQTPGFNQLDRFGAKGTMNINSNGNRTDANSYLSIGVGSRAEGRDLGNSFHVNEIVDNQQMLAGEIYQQQTGKTLNNPNTIIFLPINALLKQNQEFQVKIGALGDILEKEGIKARVFGNSDTSVKVRFAPLITMNQRGLSYGDIGTKTLVKDSVRPFGVKTNYNYLLKKMEEAKRENVSLIVFDLGDLYRLEQFKAKMDQDYVIYLREKIIYEMGDFIYTLLNEADKEQTLIVASPMVNDQAIQDKYYLAPIWIYSKEQTGNSLTSATTKREGIVANLDIAPTILQELSAEINLREFVGKPIKIINSNVNLAKEIDHIADIYKLRPSVLYPYVIWQIFILLVSLFIWVKKINNTYWFQIGLISMLYLPLLLLTSAFFTVDSPYLYLGGLILISLLLADLSVKYLKSAKLFFIIGFITFLILSIDILLGSTLMKRSFLGYDPIIGARYYGIGNEYMGIYIGSTLLFTASLLQFKKSSFTLWLTALTFAGISFMLLYPTLGTNAGGAISSFFATGFTYMNFLGIFNRKGLKWFFGILLLSMASMVVINIAIPPENQSHIGRALNQLLDGNILAVLQIIERKLAMNWKLIQVSSWSKVMITSLFAITILFIKPMGSFKLFKDKYTYIFKGFYGIIVGAFISLLVNDSGIVAAATMIIYVAVPMLYLALLKEKELE